MNVIEHGVDFVDDPSPFVELPKMVTWLSHDSKFLSTTAASRSDVGEVASSNSTVVLLELELPADANLKSSTFCSETRTLSMESCELREEEGSLAELEREGNVLEPFSEISEISCGAGDWDLVEYGVTYAEEFSDGMLLY